MANSNDAKQAKQILNQKLKGRTPEQQKVIKYFLKPEGCLSKNISDEEYENMIQAAVKGLNLKEKAINKIGIDESELKEIEPIHLENYEFDSQNAYAKKGKDGKWRSSMYQVTWLFFSDTQVYLYQYTLNMDDASKKEHTEEYFYKDITNFTSSDETIEKETWESKKGCLGGNLELTRSQIQTSRFAIVVPGEKLYCGMVPSEYTERSIQGMKAKLREKKNS